MSEAAEDNQDQSMEEILQSIKRIIADEGEDENEQSAESLSEDSSDEPAEDTPADEDATGSSVLELTELVQDDGTVTNLDEVDDASEPEAKAAPDIATEPEPADDAQLVSDNAAAASAAALSSLKSVEKPAPKPAPKIDSPAFRSGVTVEDLVMESLRPMLKDWLDSNLPSIVEHLVEKEIKRISNK